MSNANTNPTTASVVSFYTNRISLAVATIEGRGRCTPGHEMTPAEIRTEAKLANADVQCAISSARQRSTEVNRKLERSALTEEVLNAITSATATNH